MSKIQPNNQNNNDDDRHTDKAHNEGVSDELRNAVRNCSIHSVHCIKDFVHINRRNYHKLREIVRIIFKWRFGDGKRR